MSIASVVTRIQQQCPTFALVGGAAQLDAAMDALTATPAAFVLPARDTAGDNPYGNQIVQQQVDSEFSVVLAVANASDAAGATAGDDLAASRSTLRSALLNWTPETALTPCEYVGGELATFSGGNLWWTETYRTSYLIRSS